MLTRIPASWFDLVSNDFFRPATRPSFNRTLEARTTDSGLELRAELPGVAADDIEIEVAGRVLSLSARRQRDGETWQFSRKLTVSPAFDLDAVTARYDNGLLTVVVPPAAKPTGRKVTIETTSSSESGTPEAITDAAAGAGTATEPADVTV